MYYYYNLFSDDTYMYDDALVTNRGIYAAGPYHDLNWFNEESTYENQTNNYHITNINTNILTTDKLQVS